MANYDLIYRKGCCAHSLIQWKYDKRLTANGDGADTSVARQTTCLHFEWRLFPPMATFISSHVLQINGVMLDAKTMEADTHTHTYTHAHTLSYVRAHTQ